MPAMTDHRSASLFLSIAVVAWAALYPLPASAFACYVGNAPEGFVPLREQPDDKAKIIMRMASSSMVGDVRGVRERKGWIYVRWSKTQSSQAALESGKADAKGWMKRDQISGECED
jgi:hypothetical protein